MTDKQIIIDDVNVIGCTYFLKPNGCDNINKKMSCECDNTPYCYYKCWQRSEQKLKAKEQECESLGQAYLETNELLQEKTKECTNLKAENEELKKCYKNNSALLDFEETNTTKLVNKVMRLEQTLAEIRDIATCCIEGDVARIRMKQILQKINEVINE